MRRILTASLSAALAAAAVLVPAGAARAATPSPGGYVPITASRLLDTGSTPVGAGKTVTPVVTGRAGIPSSGVSAVAVTISILSPTGTGGITAYGSAKGNPMPTNLQFTRGQRVSDFAIVPVSSGRIHLLNQSTGTVRIVLDASGYYLGVGTGGPGSFHPVTPGRAYDSASGGHAPIGAGKGVNVTVTGKVGVPAPASVGSVAITITAVGATRAGTVRAYAEGGTVPGVANLHFVPGLRVSAFAVVPIASNGQITLLNKSSGTVRLVVDVSGYFRNDVAVGASTFQTVPGTTIRSITTMNANANLTIQAGGHGGVPLAGVSAALVTLHAFAPARAGSLVAFKAGTAQPGGVTNLQFAPGQTISDVALVPLSASGQFVVHNASPGTARMSVDVQGFVPTAGITAPHISVSRYLDDLTGAANDPSVMNGHGCTDATAGSTFTLLDVGAQSIVAPLSAAHPGVSLALTGGSGVHVRYDALVADVNAYLSGFAGCANGRAATIAVGTNNDSLNTGPDAYFGASAGEDWANRVIDEITVPAGLSVLGADDIEPGFRSTEAQAEAWENGYLGQTSARLVFNGSADGCPTTLGVTGATCSYGWTQAQLYYLANHGGRVDALPQVYFNSMARQWANIDATGGKRLTFAGSLTEHAAAPGTYAGTLGWSALYRAVSSVVTAPNIPQATDITVGSRDLATLARVPYARG